jgi:excisionase family DNA binding protein
MEELWDIARVAEYLGVSERTVYNRVRSGQMPAIKMGRLWRVRPSELERWLSGRRQEPAGTDDRVSDADTGTSDVGVPGPYPWVSATEPLEQVAEDSDFPHREELEHLLAAVVDPLERRLLFVGLLSRAVIALGWPAPIVVGGHAVEYYTAGDYPTIDIDLAGASEPVAQVLEDWGFEREGRHWFDEALRLLVEVSGSRPDTAVLEHVIAVHTRTVTAYVIGVEDLIIDRLCAGKYWDDSDSLLWAEAMLTVTERLDAEYLRRRAVEEDVLAELEALRGGHSR